MVKEVISVWNIGMIQTNNQIHVKNDELNIQIDPWNTDIWKHNSNLLNGWKLLHKIMSWHEKEGIMEKHEKIMNNYLEALRKL